MTDMTDPRDPVTPLTAAMKRLLDASAALRDRTDYRDIGRLQGELSQAWAEVREIERGIGDQAVRAAHDAARQTPGAATRELRDMHERAHELTWDECEVCGIIRAALQAAPVSIDRERLARAMVPTIRNFFSDTFASWSDEEARDDLRAYAVPFLIAEYDRLSHPVSVSTEDTETHLSIDTETAHLRDQEAGR